MKLSLKALSKMSIDDLLDVYENQLAYFTRTGSKIREENLFKIREEVKRRVNEK